MTQRPKTVQVREHAWLCTEAVVEGRDCYPDCRDEFKAADAGAKSVASLEPFACDF